MSKKNSSDDVPSLKGVSLTPALTALLKPSADLLGKELRDTLKESIDSWKAKRRNENLHVHIKAVKKKLSAASDEATSQGEPTFEQAEFFGEWVENVQNVDPSHTDISDLWQNLLARAVTGEAISCEVLNALKSLTPREAAFLLSLERRLPSVPFHSGRVSIEERFFATSLERKHLVEKDYAFAYILFGCVAVSLALSIAIGQRHVFPLFDTSIGVVGITTAAVVAASLGVSFRAGLARWRLTWLGRQLTSYARA